LGEGVVGRNLLELGEGVASSTLTRALARARGGSWQGELVLRRLDGEPLPVEMSIAAGSGTAVVLVRDLRERKRREFEERLVAQIDRALVSSAEPRQSVSAACAALGNAIGATRLVVLARTASRWTRWELEGGTVTRSVELPAPPPEAWEATRGVEDVEPSDASVRIMFGPLPDVRVAMRAALRGPSGAVGHLLLGRAHAGAWDPRDRALVAAVAGQIGLGLESGLLTIATRELAAYQAMVLDQTTVVIDTLDADGRVVTWNRASEQLLQVPAKDALGKRLGVEVAVATDPARWAELWSTLLRDGLVAREIVLAPAGGGEVPLHLEGRLLKDGDEVRGAVLVGLDLRDRRALERQILRSQKLAAVGLLAAGIAHEINNPLSGVVGYSKLLLERPLAPEIRERVEKIAQSGERCRKIVEGVLLFSRQQDGGVRRQVDLRALLDRVLAIGEYQWRMHNVRIIRELDEPASVLADADQIEQVVLNLLSNAVDAMPRGGAVRLRLAASPGGGASLTVADEGHGIPEEIQARIFDPFFSTKEIGKGTGLGLAISYGIVHDHGGDIVVDSAPGQGAAFTVILPASGTPEGQGR
jgi:signal transduction histidine kinase